MSFGESEDAECVVLQVYLEESSKLFIQPTEQESQSSIDHIGTRSEAADIIGIDVLSRYITRMQNHLEHGSIFLNYLNLQDGFSPFSMTH